MYYVYNYSPYLYHHGILGQKWGVRRFQNEDGTRTAAGKQRYKVDIDKAEKNYKKANETLNKVTNTDDMLKASREYAYAKEDLKSEKIKQKINDKGGLTKSQEKYKQEYMKKGMTEDEAAVAAYKRDMTKKALMIGAAVAITAVGAYAGYKYGQYACDKTLAKGTLLSRVAQTDTAGVHDAFYAVLDKNARDKDRYAGIYGNQLKSRGKDVFQKSISANADLKIASPKHAAEVMGKSLENLNIRTNLQEQDKLKELLKQGERTDRLLGVYKRADLYGKAQKELDDYVKTGKVGKNLYNALNVQLANSQADLTKQFYKDLKNAGYQGIKDVNDADYSGFMTKFPVIIADAANVKVTDVKRLDNNAINKAERLANNANLNKVQMTAAKQQVGLYTGLGATGAAVVAGSKASKTSKNNKIVADYRKEHPNTKMSYNDIVRMYERNN